MPRRHLLLSSLLSALLVLVCLAPAGAASADGPAWQSNGPEGGSIYALAVDPVTPTTLYAGTWGTGLYKSTDGGQSWRATPRSGAILTLAINPADPQMVYAGLSTGGVWRTTNGGDSWFSRNGSSPSLANKTVNALAIDPAAPDTAYAALGTSPGTGRIYRTDDGGTSWITKTTGLPDTLPVVRSLAIDPTDTGVLYAGTDAGMYKSVDHGDSWSASGIDAAVNRIRAIAIDPAAHTRVYAGTNNGVWRSLDGGATWAAFNAGLPVTDIHSLAFAGGVLYAGTSWLGVYKHGATGPWSAFGTGLPGRIVRALAADRPAGPRQLYAGLPGGIYKKGIASGPWKPANTGLVGTTINALAIHPSAPFRLYAAAYDSMGVFVSTDRGASWSRFDNGSPLDFPMALAVDSGGGHLYAATINNIYTGTLSGRWVVASSGITNTRGYALAVNPTAPGVAYVGTENYEGEGGVYLTTDGGAHWQLRNNGLPSGDVGALVVDPQTPATLYATVRNKGAYKTTNSGESWVRAGEILSTTDVAALAVDPITPTTLYAGVPASGEGVYKSTDGGDTWVLKNVGLGGRGVQALAVDPVAPATVYAGTSSGVYWSVDGGEHWAQCGNIPTPDGRVQVLVVDPNRHAGVYAGTLWGGVAALTRLWPQAWLPLLLR